MPALDPITGKDPSSLTVGTLAERLAMERALREQMTEALERLFSERIQNEALTRERQWTSHDEAHEVANVARIREQVLAARAVEVAESARAEALRIASEAFEAYKKVSNEFRGTLEDQAGHFVTKSENDAVISRIAALENDRIARDAAVVTKAAADSESKTRETAERSRQQWTTGLVIGLVSIGLSAAVGLILRLAFPT